MTVIDRSMFEPGEPPPNLIRSKQYKTKNAERCGSWIYVFNPTTGKGQSLPYCCNRRDCQRCRDRIAKVIKKGMLAAVRDHNVEILFLPRKDTTNLIRSLHKSDFQRLPLEDYDILFINADKLNRIMNGEKIDSAWVENANWSEMFRTPEGRKRSGSLGSPKTVGKTEKFAMIAQDQVFTNAEHKLVLGLMKEVIKDTSHLQPKTAKEVEDALKVRTATFMNKLIDMGYTVEMYIHRTKVILAHINWVSDFSIVSYMDSIKQKNDIDYSNNRTNLPPMKQKPMPI